jgi:Zn-dependent membrane protease YugP
MLRLRSALVPVVTIASSIQQYIFMFALGGLYLTKSPWLMMIALVVFGVTALFSLVTLPVEFDASKRALVWLDSSGVASGAQHEGAKDALFWAAMTYISAALAALVQFLYLLMRFLGSRD